MHALSLRTERSELWQGRMGRLPEEITSHAPWDIWIQAVSVGEVGVAGAIVREALGMEPGLKIVVSSFTEAGYERASETLGDVCGVMPCPVDFPQAVRRAVGAIRPRVFVCIETELWPSMLQEMRRNGIATMLLNGRISARSFPRYMKIRSVISGLLHGFSMICAGSSTSARRLLELGACKERLVITGNAKYQALLARPEPASARAQAELMGIPPAARVLVAGSIRSGDEAHIIQAWKALETRFPDLHLVVVPRHLENVTMLQRLFAEQSIPFSLYSHLQEKGDSHTARVIIVDRIGPLFDLYGIASVAFVGGSLAAKGGQNILEPAAWSCPVLYGPHTENFEDATAALEKENAGGLVRNGQELADRTAHLLSDSSDSRAAGQAARKALENIASGAATRQAEALITQWAMKTGNALDYSCQRSENR